MNGMTKQLYMAIGALFLLAFLTPVIIKVLVTVMPLVGIIGLVIVVVRLVWSYTDRY